MYTVYVDKGDGNGWQWNGEHTDKGIAVACAKSLALTWQYRTCVLTNHDMLYSSTLRGAK